MGVAAREGMSRHNPVFSRTGRVFLTKQGLLFSVHIVFSGGVGIVTYILSAIYFYDMSVRVHTSFNFSDSIRAPYIFSVSNIVSVISTAFAVMVANNFLSFPSRF